MSSSDRGQTLQLLNVEHNEVTDDGITFVIFDQLKTSKRNSRPHQVKCITSEIPSLNVSSYVLAYMNRTITLHAKAVSKGLGKPTQLFLSWATQKPVTKATISRWLALILHNLKLTIIEVLVCLVLMQNVQQSVR